MSKDVAIAGVGLMGHGIAKNIVSKGWRLRFLDHPGNQPAEDLEAQGAVREGDLAALAGADVVLLCVTGTPQVEAILLGSEGAPGLLEALRPGTTVIDCSTAVPSSTEALAAKVQEKGCRFMDAAMTRTPKEAEEGRLNLLVGGEAELLDEMRPLLECFAENIFHAGGVGAGHTLKLLHNFVSLGSAVLIAEAAACAERGGIAPEVLVDALKRGGGYGAALDRMSPFLLEGDSASLRFTTANAAKDLDYYTRMARDLGAWDATAEGVLASLNDRLEAGEGERYVPELAARLGRRG